MEDLPGYIAAGSDMNALPRDAKFDEEIILEGFVNAIQGKLNNGENMPL